MNALERLVEVDGLKVVDGAGHASYVHREHRWVLPLVLLAQQEGALPQPCKLILFDRHHDALPVASPKRDALADLRRRGVTVDGVLDVCANVLRKSNDDWILGGMDLGLFSDAVIFGVESDVCMPTAPHLDVCDESHRLFFPSLPGGALQYQGDLSDLAKRGELRELWDVLEWRAGNGVFSFPKLRDRFLLDFDLDCFAVRWGGYCFPWPDKVWHGEFFRASGYHTTIGWTGALWVGALAQAAGLVTFATEPDHCGGVEDSRQIWDDVNRFLFGGRLRRRPVA